jgi:hypothetical protein
MNKLISLVVCVLFVALCKSELIQSPRPGLYRNVSEVKCVEIKSDEYLKDECTSYVDLIDNLHQFYENPSKNESFLDENDIIRNELLNILIDKVELQQINMMSTEFYDL